MEDVSKIKTEERVLAYSLATEISEEELTQIAGGSATSTQAQTRHPSIMGGDVTYDVNGD